MQLQIYDRDLKFLGIFEVYTSLRWERKYYKSGRFELHCPLNSYTVNLMSRGNIIFKSDDKEAAVIDSVTLGFSNNPTGAEILIVKGKFLTNYLSRRILWGQYRFNGPAELAIRQLIDENVLNPTNPDRKIPYFKLGELNGFSNPIDRQVTFRNLLETVEEIARDSGLGIRTVFDMREEEFIFETYEGINRIEGNGINPPAIFSRAFENVLAQTYVNSLDLFKNTALIAGEDVSLNRKIVAIEEGSGFDRHETYVDARDLRQDNLDGVVYTEEEYEAILLARGSQKLEKLTEKQSFDSEVNLQGNLVYKVDFDLGDLVTCIDRDWNVRLNIRIVEIQEIYEGTGRTIFVTFGENLPTLAERVQIGG